MIKKYSFKEDIEYDLNKLPLSELESRMKILNNINFTGLHSKAVGEELIESINKRIEDISVAINKKILNSK